MHSKPPHTSPPHLPQMQLYRDWLSQERGLDFDSFEALWRWSVSDVAAFWQSIWDYFGLHSPTPIACVLRDLPMTRVVVAHRPVALEGVERVFVVSAGRLLERKPS